MCYCLHTNLIRWIVSAFSFVTRVKCFSRRYCGRQTIVRDIIPNGNLSLRNFFMQSIQELLEVGLTEPPLNLLRKTLEAVNKRWCFRTALLWLVVSIFSLLQTSNTYATNTFPGVAISGSGSITASNSGADAEPLEPTAGGNAAFNPVQSMWYSWTAAASGTLVVQTCGSTVTSFDTVLGIYTGATVSTLTSLAFNDDAANCAVGPNNGYGSSITLAVTAGTTYQIQVDGYGGATGTFFLQYEFAPTAAITVIKTDGSATEGSDTATFQIRLGSAPTANVTVSIAPDPATPDQCTFSATTLTFTTANWNTFQSVIATAVNDTIAEGNHTCSTGAITAAGGGFTGATGIAPTFTITDNDLAALIILNTDSTATEGGATGTFTVRLATVPTANVSVTIGTSPQCTFATSPLTFTTANWNANQTITVTAINDAVVEGAHSCVTGAITATGGGYTGVTGAAQTFTITDNDTGAVTVATSVATATEGGANGAFTVVLTAQPATDVTVTIAADPAVPDQCTFAPTPLTFTNANWNVAQTVTTTAVDDTLVEGSHTCTTGAITSSGSGYTATGTAPTFTITDNDTGGITVATTLSTATEGGTNGAFTVVLTAQPTSNVTVTIAPDPATPDQCTFAPSSLTFTNANWNSAQAVATTAVDDTLVEGAHTCTTGAITSSGSGYSATGTAPTFTITDNDTGAITVTTTTATATEGGATGAFTVVLTAQPATNVTVTIAADPATPDQCTFAPTPLTFTNANWNTAQTVTTTAVDDTLVEGAHSCVTGVISGAGSGYTGVTGTAPIFTITDNDTGAITVTTTTASATEGGATGAFTVVLTAQPATDVTVTIAPDPATPDQCAFAPSPLTFTTANWNTAQIVTTTAVNDIIVEGAHSCTTGAIAAFGSGYTGVTGTAPTFTIVDNDVGSITIVTTTSTAAEGGATGAFTVVLTAQPATDVTITIAADPAAPAQCTFAPSPLTFTSANWNTAQTVTTTAVNDTLVEGVHTCTTGAISGAGSGYTGVTAPAPTFTITDNDTGAITVVTTIATATEGGATGAFTVVLTAQPASDVTVTIAIDGSGQCTFAPSPLTFTTVNWATAQTVTTTAVNDTLVEGAHSCTTGVITSSGSGYSASGTAPTFSITDNDIASILLEKTASVASVTIAGEVISYTLKITNTGNVIASGLTVTDSLVSVVCPTSGSNTIASLAPSGFENCTASYTADQTDFDTNGGGDGDIDNSASVAGVAGGVAVASADSAAVLCTPNSGLTIVKSANTAGPLHVNDVVTFTFRAINTGNVTLSDVSITELAFTGANPPLGTPALETFVDNLPTNTSTQKTEDFVANNGVFSVLKPNDEAVFSLQYTVTQDDVDLLQ
jgi:large repetitive protein